MKKSTILCVLVIFLFAFKANSQVETTKTIDLLGDLESSVSDTVKLLPDHFIFTQRMMWGEKGLMRNFKSFELSPEERQRELKIRRGMLVAHQATGFVTLGAMVAQGIVGTKLYNGNQLSLIHISEPTRPY